MKPAWDQLMEKFQDHRTVLIGDVDCTGSGSSLCQTINVRSYPTIKYGPANALNDYEGGRTSEALEAFANEIQPVCNPSNLDVCDSATQEKVRELQKLSIEELGQRIKEKKDKVEAAQTSFREEVDRLNAKLKQLHADKEAVVSEIRDSGLSIEVMVHSRM